MRKKSAKFSTSFISEVGTSRQNSSYFDFAEMDNFACYVVSEGINDVRELGSAKIAVTSIIRQFSEHPSLRKQDILSWLETANNELLATSGATRLKASLTVVVTDYTYIIFGATGNTRLYLFRGGTLLHRTIDQSFSSNLADDEKKTLDRISSRFERHDVYCYLGQPVGFCPEISGKIKLMDGDYIALLTKGIWDSVDINEIAEIVKEAEGPHEVLRNVKEVLYVRQRRAEDNYVLAVVYADKTYEDSRKALIRGILYTAIPVMLAIVGMLILGHVSEARKESQVTAMSEHITLARTLCEQGDFPRATEEYRAALAIAQKLKMKNEQRDLAKFYTAADLTVAGDSALQQKDYARAVDKYSAALDASFFADRLGQAYILKQWRLARDYIDVNELIQEGDRKSEQRDYTGAAKEYLEAKVIASRIDYPEGRQIVTDKLTQLSELSRVDGQKMIEQEAAVYEQQGDWMAQRADYQGSLIMLGIASGMYNQVGKNEKILVIKKKVAVLKDKITAAEKAEEQENIIQEAAQYEKQGDKLLSEKADIAGALDLYNLALNLYIKSDKQEKIALMQMKIDNINARKK